MAEGQIGYECVQMGAAGLRPHPVLLPEGEGTSTKRTTRRPTPESSPWERGRVRVRKMGRAGQPLIAPIHRDRCTLIRSLSQTDPRGSSHRRDAESAVVATGPGQIVPARVLPGDSPGRPYLLRPMRRDTKSASLIAVCSCQGRWLNPI